MGSKWPEARVDDIAVKVAMGPFGSNIKVETFVSSGIPVISGQHLHGFRLDEASGYNFITEEHARRLANCVVKPGDVIFTHAGSIGQVAYVPRDAMYERYVISQRQFYMRCDTSRVLPEYITYYFRSRLGQHQLLANASSAGVPSIARPATYLRGLSIPVPPLDVQRGIAAVLGSIEGKIELNRRMADTLDGVAQTLYSLLVESSEEVDRESPSFCSLADVAVLTKQTVNPQSAPDRVFEHYSLPAFDIGRLPHLQRGEAIKSQKTLVPDGAVLLSKLNPQFPRVWMPELSGEDNAIASTEFLVLTPRRGIPRSFLYCAISSSIFTRRLQAYVTGTSGSHQRVKPQTVMEMSVPCVSRDVLEEFDRMARPVLERASNAIRQGDTLRQMRDVLLPPLLDGRIEVPPVADEEVS